MKRHVLRLAMFLLLGAVINVAVGWGSALLPLPTSNAIDATGKHDVFNHWRSTVEQTDPYVGYTVHRWNSAIKQRVVVFWNPVYQGHPWSNTARFEDLIPTWAEEWLDVPELTGGTSSDDWSTKNDLRVVEARGWPLYGLWGGIRFSAFESKVVNGQLVPKTVSLGFAIPIDDMSSFHRTLGIKSRFLPLSPIWFGFAINTLFYAAIAWLLLAFPGAARRGLRRRRGRCIKCGYDLRGAPPIEGRIKCPECGRQTPSPSPSSEGEGWGEGAKCRWRRC